MKELKGVPIITLHQPWAFYIMMEWKTIETRLHDRFKGLVGKTIGIHSSLRKTTFEEINSNAFLTRLQKELTKDAMLWEGSYYYKWMRRGCILGTIKVTEANWSNLWTDENRKAISEKALIECENTDRFLLWLENINKFDSPIPAKGKQGIWYYKPNF